MGRLAKPGSPYVTERGEVHVPKTDAAPQERSMTLSTPIARSMHINSRRNMNEMPNTDPSTQTAINAVLMYQLLGLTDNETAHMLRLDLVTVQNLKMHSDYQATWEMLFAEVVNVNSGSLQATLAAHAQGAIERIVDLSKTSEHEMTKLKANQDLADRAGLHYETLHGKNSSNGDEDTLKISFVNEADTPRVDIEIKRK